MSPGKRLVCTQPPSQGWLWQHCIAGEERFFGCARTVKCQPGAEQLGALPGATGHVVASPYYGGPGSTCASCWSWIGSFSGITVLSTSSSSTMLCTPRKCSSEFGSFGTVRGKKKKAAAGGKQVSCGKVVSCYTGGRSPGTPVALRRPHGSLLLQQSPACPDAVGGWASGAQPLPSCTNGD